MTGIMPKVNVAYPHPSTFDPPTSICSTSRRSTHLKERLMSASQGLESL